MAEFRHLKTQGEIAASLGISRDAIKEAAAIRRNGAPQVSFFTDKTIAGEHLREYCVTTWTQRSKIFSRKTLKSQTMMIGRLRLPSWRKYSGWVRLQ
jgi:hypothetical protein